MIRLLLILLLIAPAVRAQSPADTPRPTVGLVLSGGSAKGIAHVGAIRLIEEAGLPVDVVTGTSMGSIVGGMYALGYTPDQMQQIVASRDWTALFLDAVDRRESGLERRVGAGGALVSLPIEGGSLTLPSGLVAGQGIFELLADLTWPAAQTQDFTQLPRPFAAVVVNTDTGEAERLTSGSLPLAIRASMSLPSLFEPVEIGGTRYIDGGLIRNLPAEDAQALGADILVCVDVSKTADAGDARPTFFDVFVNAAFYAADLITAQQRELCDVVIEPDVEGLSPFAFDQAESWIMRGEEAARAQLPALRALAERVGRTPTRLMPPENAPMQIRRVEVRGASGQARNLVRSRLAFDVPPEGRRVSQSEVAEAVRRVYTTGAFDLVTYSVESTSLGNTLIFEVRAAALDRLGFGFRYDTQYDAALLFTLTLQNRLRFGSTAQLEARLGDHTQLRALYFTRLGIDSRWTVTGTAGYASVPVDVFAGADRAVASGALEVVSARTYAGPVLLESLLTGFGPGVTYVRAAPDVAPEGVEGISDTYVSLGAFAASDSRDRSAFASRGHRFEAQAEWSPGLGAEFGRTFVSLSGALPIAPHTSLIGRASLAHGWGDPTPDQLTYVGGALVPALLPGRFVAFYGADEQELIGTSAQVAAVGVQVAIGSTLFARLLVDAGRAGSDLSFDPDAFATGFGVSLGTDTPAGPVELLLSGNLTEDSPGLTFRLGRSF